MVDQFFINWGHRTLIILINNKKEISMSTLNIDLRNIVLSVNVTRDSVCLKRN